MYCISQRADHIWAEKQGATPHEVRAILDGDLSWLDEHGWPE